MFGALYFKVISPVSEYSGFENKHIEITDYIIKKIIISLNETLHLTKKQLEYIWACKKKSAGYHIYFPNIIVDKILHQYIFDETIKTNPIAWALTSLKIFIKSSFV